MNSQPPATVDHIEVYCQASSHAKKRWRIGTFELGSGGQWYIDDHLARGGEKQVLSGDRRLPRVLTASLADQKRLERDGMRERYPLRCRLCDLSLPRRVHENRDEDALQLALDKIGLAGESEISLSALAAIVARVMR